MYRDCTTHVWVLKCREMPYSSLWVAFVNHAVSELTCENSKLLVYGMFMNLKSCIFKWNIYHVNREDDADGYTSIDEKPDSKTLQLPARAQSMTKRPPAPLPSAQRPHSNSSPGPLPDCSPSRNTLPVPPRRQSSDFSQHPASRTLPRPPDNRTLPTRPLTMGTFPRGISEPAKQSKGYEDVVNQLSSANLRSPNKKGKTFPDQCFNNKE